MIFTQEEIANVPMTFDSFPVVYSTLAPQALIDRVLPLYAIPEVISCQLWNRGLSDVYLVKTLNNQYILKVSHHHWRSKSDIDFELELLDFFQQRQLPVAYPLKTIDRRLSVEINAPEGNRYAALFIYASGRVPLGDLNTSQSFLLGKTLAKLHQTSIDFQASVDRQPLNLDYLLDDSWQKIAPFFKHRHKDFSFLKATIIQLKEQLDRFPQKPPFWVICWGDPHSGNVHFTANNQLTLFDFDQCGYGWRAFDIAKFLQVCVRTGISKKVREAFLSGYQETSQVSESEINSLQALTQTAHIWMWAISLNYASFHNYCKLDESFFTQRIEQLKRLKSKDWLLF